MHLSKGVKGGWETGDGRVELKEDNHVNMSEFAFAERKKTKKKQTAFISLDNAAEGQRVLD